MSPPKAAMHDANAFADVSLRSAATKKKEVCAKRQVVKMREVVGTLWFNNVNEVFKRITYTNLALSPSVPHSTSPKPASPP